MMWFTTASIADPEKLSQNPDLIFSYGLDPDPVVQYSVYRYTFCTKLLTTRNFFLKNGVCNRFVY
jgi:hypothetical protein